jgi:ABC-type uncharacterized transport system auxiliary subunit
MKRLLAVLLVPLLLSACGNVPPAPVDHFYRLQPLSGAGIKVLPDAVAVRSFRADSLYAERPIIYVDAARPRELHQYHYHLWLYPPARTVQDHLIASLGGALDFVANDNAPYALDGHVLSFERVVSGGSSKAVVSLGLRLMSGETVLLDKTYQDEQTAVDDSLGAFVVAMEKALGRAYAEFLADAAKLR